MNGELLERLISRGAVEPAEVEATLDSIMAGSVADPLIAAFLVALRGWEHDSAILAACARAMRGRRRAVRAEVRPLIDTCGTGGDRSGTFNISTTTAFVVAAAGGAVVKHGNRGVSSKSGSADVLEAAGCALALEPEAAAKLLDATGFAFLFAPAFHPAMAKVAPVRWALRVRTIFNLLGPLTNPAAAQRQLIGVYDPAITKVMADALCVLGTEQALVIHCDGLDEVGLHGVTRGHRVRQGIVEPFSLDPCSLGLSPAPIDSLAGGDASQNAEIVRAILAGEDKGPKSDVVALNAACALDVAGLVNDIPAGLRMARDVLHSGAARRVLERYVESSQRAARGRP